MALLTPNKTCTVNGVTLNEKIIPDGTRWKDGTKAKKAGFSANSLYKKQQKLSGGTGKPGSVTIHNTDDLDNVHDDGEQYTRATYNENMGSVRVHFYVDDVCVWQNLKAGTGLFTSDPVNSAEVSWHAGDGSASDGGNMTSISIEVIMNDNTAHDERAKDNSARLAAWLLWKHGLSIDDLVTHTYWVNKSAGKRFSDVDEQCCNLIPGKKWCPTYIFKSSNKQTAMKNWKAYKQLVKKYMDALDGTTESKPTTTAPSTTNQFKQRTSAPSTTDKYWIHTSNGGLNECIEINNSGSCLPNCVGYAWGRFYEITGNRPKLSRANAENWYGYTSDGYKRSQTPVQGAVICWRKGQAGNGADGAGHVAIVEEVKSNGDVVTSNSAYGGTRFYMKTVTKSSGYHIGSAYVFQGFILPPGTTASTGGIDTTPFQPSTSAIKEGDEVKIAANATYYSGKTIPTWVKNKTWIVSEVDGNRAVINKSADGKNAINSPINTKYLTAVSAAVNSGSNNTTTVTTPTTSTSSNEKAIWGFLIRKGLSPYAVAGIMGNLYAESALNPCNLQNTYEKKLGYKDTEYVSAVDSGKYTNFVKDSAGFGLAQWTYWSRKQALLEYAQKTKKSIGDLGMQLEFLWSELQGYTKVMNTLKSATSVQTASDAVLTGYERPADQGAAVKTKRASYGQKYYDKYASSTTISGGTEEAPNAPYLVKVTASALNIRKQPTTRSVITGRITNKGVYTIVEESDGQGATKWGLLKSKVGWISLDYTTKV